MTLIIQKPTGAKVVLRKTWQPMDSDAAAYITAVETADGQALEEKTKIAIDNFVLGCKADGIWSAIKASCILAGARTLNGALVPLVGAAPTNVGPFVAGDYNRKTGLISDGSTKYINTNRNNNAEPQDRKHLATFVSTAGSTDRSLIGAFGGASGSVAGSQVNTAGFIRINQTGNASSVPDFSADTGMVAVNRSSSAGVTLRRNSSSATYTASSSSPASGDIHVFSRNLTGSNTVFNGRLAFYSIGESLDLAKLDARVTDLINAFGAAIP